MPPGPPTWPWAWRNCGARWPTGRRTCASTGARRMAARTRRTGRTRTCWRARPADPFSSNVSNLLYGLTYYYRCYASNQWGTAWAPATTNFTTLRPASSLANSAATGITTNAAALNATLACTGAVYNVVAFWNTVRWRDQRRAVDQLGLRRLLDQCGLDEPQFHRHGPGPEHALLLHLPGHQRAGHAVGDQRAELHDAGAAAAAAGAAGRAGSR